ncbi:MAG: ATP-dependent Clp protease proteolytic subunit [Pseudanabaenaceae cyanobacterium]|jgi:ATP-dependent protease ClpP protease subunit
MILELFKFNANGAMITRKLLVNIFLTASTVFFYPCSVSGETIRNQNINSESPKVQPQPTNENKTVVINFSVGVSKESVTLLMQTVSNFMSAGHKDFLLLINSDGGDTEAGIAAYNYLSSLPVTIRTHNISSVKSAATDIYCAGSYRTASPNSVFLLHNSTVTYRSDSTVGQINGLNQWYRFLLNSRLKIFSICAGISEKQSKDIYDNESVFNASEAKNVGFVNEVRNVKIESNVIFVNYDLFKR